MPLDRYVYIIAIQGTHGAELTTSLCGYYSYNRAEVELKKLHAKGLTYMKIFTIQMMDYVESQL